MPGSVYRLFERLRGALIPALWALMHTVWIAALVRAVFSLPVMHPLGVVYPLWLIPALLLGGALLEARLAQGERSWLVGAILGLGLVLVTFLLLPLPGGVVGVLARWRLVYRFVEGMPSLLVAGLTTGALWGAGLAADWSDQGAVWRGFVLGTMVLALLMLLPASLSGQTTQRLAGSMALFVFSGLLLLALRALTTALAEGRQGYGLGVGRYWLAYLAGLTLVILAAGALIGWLVTPDAVTALLATLWPILRIALTPLFWLLQWGGYLLLLLLAMLLNRIQIAGGQGATVEEPRVPMDLAEQLRRLEEGVSPGVNLPSHLARTLLMVALAGALLMAFYLLWRRRQRRHRGTQAVEQRESILSGEIVLDQLRQTLARLRLRRSGDPYAEALSGANGREAMRLLYRRVLSAARRIGRPRMRGQTPQSYARTLGSLLPAERDSVQAVTARYAEVRYGEREPSAAELREAGAAVERIERALREQR
ncbi:MAG: DUF4129 domain-containing protein [Anaerolineae bacterium]|jgi:hypothetical protein|nr:DUF4129 domain-containing protein [Chloroflexota bacterium]